MSQPRLSQAIVDLDAVPIITNLLRDTTNGDAGASVSCIKAGFGVVVVAALRHAVVLVYPES